MDAVNDDVDLDNDGNIFDILKEMNDRWIRDIAKNFCAYFMNFKQFVMFWWHDK